MFDMVLHSLFVGCNPQPHHDVVHEWPGEVAVIVQDVVEEALKGCVAVFTRICITSHL